MFEHRQGRLSYRLYCGDYAETIKEDDFNLIFTSPPYNIGSQSPKKLTNRRRGGYDSKSWGAIEHYDDNMPEEEYQAWQKEFLRWCAQRIKPNGVICYNHKDRHRNGELIQPESWFPEELQLFDKVIWDRGSTHNHCKNYAYQVHEYVCCLRLRGQTHFYNNYPLSSVIHLPPERNNEHNAPMPVKLPAQFMYKFMPAGGTACDPFSGSGTTMLAASLCDMSFVGSEKKPEYYALAEKRFRQQSLRLVA